LALFNREAEKAGLEYWYAKVADKTFTPAGAAIAILNGALNADAIAIENKLAASAAFSAALDTSAEMIGYSGAGAAASARSFLSTITATAATAAAVDAAVAAAVTATTSVSGQTFTLTTGVDTITGSGNNDLFIADNTGTDVSSAADTLSGGAGSDTLNVYSDGAAGSLPSLTSVETLNVYDQDDSMTTATTSQASLTAVNLIRGDGAMTLTVGAAVTNVGVADVVAASGGVVITAAATATSLTVNLNGVTAAAASGVTDENVDVNGTLLTSVTVNTSGTASSVDVLDVASATTININAAVGLTATSLETGATIAALNISGAGAVSLGTLDSAIDTITSTASGATTAAIGSQVDTVLSLGSGNDVITASTADTIATADKLSVDAGAGTGDVLVIAETVDVDTAADAARYTNFEVIRTATAVNASLVAGITAIQTTGAATITAMSAEQAAAVTVRSTAAADTADALSFALNTATGTSDVISITAGVGTTTTEAPEIAALTIDGFETLNLKVNPGPTAAVGDARTTDIASFTAANVTKINLTGTAVAIANMATTKAVTIDGSALTGDGAAGTSLLGLTVAGNAKIGSSIIGSSLKDSLTVGAAGSTYNGGAGNDTFTIASAVLLADGTDDAVLIGGDGTDTLAISDAASVTDVSLTNVTGFEKLTLIGGNVNESVQTLGAAARAAFPTGMTVTEATIQSAAKSYVFNSALYDKNVTITHATSGTGTADESSQTIITGTGNDTVTLTAGSWTGAGGGVTQGVITISTGAGVDTITVSTGTLSTLADADSVIITPGLGADIVDVTTHVNGADSTSAVYGDITFKVAAGDSTTTAYDSIKGFAKATADEVSDTLAFTAINLGTYSATAATGFSASEFAVAVSNVGLVAFTGTKASTATLAEKIDAVKSVVITTSGDTAFFTHVTNSVTSTYVFNNHASGDSIVELVGVSGATALITTNASTALAISILAI